MTDDSLQEFAVKARQETAINLSIAAHYANAAQYFLELGDDAGAVYTLQRFAENARAALREFKPLREAMIARGRKLEAAQ